MSKLQGARVDLILDNAGFELYADLMFTLYLLSSGIAAIVVLHPKSIPWYLSFPPLAHLAYCDMGRFVSDVIPRDIGHLFTSLSNPAYFNDEKRNFALDFVVARLKEYYRGGRIIVPHHNFWTTQHSFWRLPTYEPDLLADLEKSDLLVFKGDLNYRKYSLLKN